MPKQRLKKWAVRVQDRRNQVMTLVRAGYSYRIIAGQLKISVGTVASDVAAVMADWREQRLHDIEEAKALDLNRADSMLQVAFQPALRSDPAAQDRVMRILEFRMKCLGYASPGKHTLAGGEWEGAKPIQIAPAAPEPDLSHIPTEKLIELLEAAERE